MLITNCFGVFDVLTTTPAHWLLCSGIILYALAMSLVATWDPVGRFLIIVHTIQKVPQVQGKLLELSRELMEGVGRFMCGYDRFCIG